MTPASRIALVAVTTAAASLALSGEVSVDEAVAAIGVALVMVAWAWPDHGTAPPAVDMRAHVSPWTRAMLDLPRACARTTIALVRSSIDPTWRGTMSTVPFDHGPRDDPASQARRATATFAFSLAPDRFLVRMPSDRDEVTIHAIVPIPHPPDRRWLR